MVLERDRSFPLSQALSVSTSVQRGGVRRQKQKSCTGQRPAQSKVVAGQELGPLTKLGRLGGASLPEKP